MLFITNRVPDEGLAVELGQQCTFRPEFNAVCNAVFFCQVEPDGSHSQIGSKKLFETLKESDAKQILFFVHGFNVSPDVALERAAKLQEFCDLRNPGEVLVVAWVWPTDDDRPALILNDYMDDLNASQLSGGAFARVLAKFHGWGEENPEFDKPINMISHSMGNRLLRETLQFWEKHLLPGAVPQVFDNTFLTAADIAYDQLEFGQPGEIICQASRNVVVYHARDDVALMASTAIHNKPGKKSRRLGSGGPRAISQTPDCVFSLDCNAFARKYDKKRGHTYFLNSHSGKSVAGKVLKHMIRTIADGETLTKLHGFRIGRLK